MWVRYLLLLFVLRACITICMSTNAEPTRARRPLHPSLVVPSLQLAFFLILSENNELGSLP
jgi:hypothetical protein